MARNHHPDLILMDIRLPDMDGLAATRILKADPRTRDIRIIAVTAYAMAADRARALAAGCDGFITKPIDQEKLLSEIELLARRPS